MVYIHGGLFIRGGATETKPPELVTQNDVIVVQIQYRLGVLGFLSSGDDVSSGNYGLHDQNMAITWTKNNIRAFGGDPDDLTVSGTSAGSISVGLQLLSPYSKGLFTKAILMSGVPTSAIINKSPQLAFHSLANQTGCLPTRMWSDSFYYTMAGGWEREERRRIVECLRDLDAQTFLQFGMLSIQDEYGFSRTNPWGPTVDGDFIPRLPRDLMNDVDYLVANDVTSRKVMLSTVNEEGGLLVNAFSQGQPLTPDNFNGILAALSSDEIARDAIKNDLLYWAGEELSKDPQRLKTLIDVLDFFYTKPLTNGRARAQDVVTTTGDISFSVPTVQFARDLVSAQQKARSSTGSVYLYLFNHYPSSKASLSQLKGTYHAEDLAYLMTPTFSRQRDAFNADDVTVGNTLRAMQSSFAKTGQPQVSVQAGGVWPEFSMVEEKFLSLEVNPRVDDHLFSKRVALWTQLLPSLLNSTRPQDSYNNPGCMTGTKNFVFKGRLNFFKLH